MPGGVPADVHPYRALWRTRDLDAWGDALAADVVLHSPVVTSPFRGREQALELFGVLFETLRDFEITHELGSGEAQAFFWQADAGGRQIEGADLVRMDEHGKVAEITVLIRTLVGIAAFASATGPRLAARLGPLRSLLVRILNLPLRAFLAVLDRVAPLLVQRR